MNLKLETSIKWVLVMIVTMLNMVSFVMPSYAAINPSIPFTQEETDWIEAHKGATLQIGIDPYSGIEYFLDGEEEMGYVFPFTELLQKQIGLPIRVVRDRSWGDVFNALHTGEIDILMGANETPERKSTMNFTKAVHSYPYVMYKKSGNSIYTMGDIDGKRVAFITGDMVQDTFPEKYSNINFTGLSYDTQAEAFNALRRGDVAAFITSGGETAYAYLFQYGDIDIVSEIGTISSEMTLSTRKDNSVLAGILDKVIDKTPPEVLKSMIEKSRKDYVRTMLPLSGQDKLWLKSDPTVVVGIAKDYLPFEYFKDGQFEGITGMILEDIAVKAGMKLVYEYDDFDVLYQKLIDGKIDVLNVAKSEERKKLMYFSNPYLLERDEIYGRTGTKDVIDIYGLEGKKVAVVKGYYQEDMLQKNLVDPRTIEFKNLMEALRAVDTGLADYIIENPSVIRYYTEELGMNSLIKRGSTNTDTYLYFGINLKKPSLLHVIDSMIPILRVEQLAIQGYESVPHRSFFEKNRQFMAMILFLIVALVFVVYKLKRSLNELISEKAAKEILIEREKYLYRDNLTGLYNRNYLMDKVIVGMDEAEYPQAIVICDMNGLKMTNDTYGHHIGDQMLIEFTNMLNDHFPDRNIFRMGGDEFMILATGEDALKLQCQYDAWMENTEEHTVDFGENMILRVWGSYGVALRHDAGVSFSDVIKAADAHMYAVKAKQKNKEKPE